MAEAFRIGRYKVHRIEEWQGGFSPPEALFAEFEAQAFAQVADAFEPDCLREGMVYGYLQSWLIDTGDMRVLVDTGAGNGKQRPG
ncbi:MAG: MBL fold metallo-hydrolase, partial [Pseudomonadota bacterium]|nr:MBL fold metallo-hydrolase [Pseudomonadota bacterium]